MLLGALALECEQERIVKGAHIFLHDAHLAVNVTGAADVRTAPAESAVLGFHADHIADLVDRCSVLGDVWRVSVEFGVQLGLGDDPALKADIG